MCFKKKLKQKDKKTVKKVSYQWWESNSRPLTCKVSLLSIAPRQLMLNGIIELIIYITIAHEILPVDRV